MIKKLLSLALIAGAISLNAQQAKIGKTHSNTLRGLNPSVAATTNLDWETWSGGNPTGWLTVNSISPGNVTQYTVSPGQGASSGLITTQSCTACPNYGLPKNIGVAEEFVPYVGQPTTLSFMYKCSINAGDTGSVYVGLSVATAPTGKAYMVLTGSVTSWTTVTVPFTYSNQVNSDTINILVLSSDSGFITGYGVGHPSVGSKLYIDAIAITTSAGVQKIMTYSDYVMFPNPAVGELNFIVKNQKASKVEIFDMSGRMINSFAVENEKTQINTEKMTSGMYFYRVTDANGATLHTDKFNIAK